MATPVRHTVLGRLATVVRRPFARDSEPQTLIDGVRAAAEGHAPLDRRATRALLDARAETSKPRLTARETDVLRLDADGLANKDIARQLQISEKTVKSHLTRIFSVVGVTDRTQAALWARDNLAADAAVGS